MKLYIIRHGETEWNTVRRLQGWQNSPLTENGINAAKQLGERFKKEGQTFDKIYTSTQRRAIDTAKYIRGDNDTDIIQMDELMEIGYGAWEGMLISDIHKEYGKEYDIYLNHTHLYKPIDGGETFDQVFKRVEEALDYISSQDYENVLIVSHGVTIKVIISLLKGIPLEKFNTIPIHRGTAINIYELDGDRVNYLVEGDLGHIGG